MDLKKKIRKILKENYGSFDSYLEHKYEDTITENLASGTTKIRQAWVTYNQVILELKNNLNNTLKVKELQYRLTDKSDPNNVCIEVISDIKDKSPELQRLYEKIKNLSLLDN
jgi:hypothetical protein